MEASAQPASALPYVAWSSSSVAGIPAEQWDTPEQLEAFLERGYTFERMLEDVAGLAAEPTVVMEKVF